MTASFSTYKVTIPVGSKYRHSPERITEDVLPYLRKFDSSTQLERLCEEGVWKLTTSRQNKDVVTRVLITHFGFSLSVTSS